LSDFNIDNMDIRSVSFANWKSFDMYRFLECSDDFDDAVLNMDSLVRNGLDEASIYYIKESSSFQTSVLVRDYWLSTGVYPLSARRPPPKRWGMNCVPNLTKLLDNGRTI